MTTSSTKSAFLAGLRDGAPFLLVITPFATLFGVAATEAGLDLLQTMSFSVLVIAGAAQFSALQLMLDGASVPLVLLASLAVNLRMAMYSAALVPHLGAAPFWQCALVAYVNFDQTYTTSIARFERAPPLSVAEKVMYFMGVASSVTPAWYGFTLIGALAGASIPAAFALDFAVPITFLALVAPMLRTLAHLAAACVSVLGTLALSWLPAGVGLLLAAVAAMGTGVLIETLIERRRAASAGPGP